MAGKPSDRTGHAAPHGKKEQRDYFTARYIQRLRLRSVGVKKKKGSNREFLFVCFCVRQRVRVLRFCVGLICRTGNYRLELQAAVILLFYDSASLRACDGNCVVSHNTVSRKVGDVGNVLRG